VRPRRPAGASVRPLDFTVRHCVDMPDLRPFALIGALALGVTSASAMDLSGYSVVKLHPGLNNLDRAFSGHPISVVIGHRENFNSHSFDVVTFYLWDRDAAKGLDIVGLWDKDNEALSLQVSGGADCLLHDFRLLWPNRGRTPLLVVADHPLLTSYIENAPVTFKFYTLKQNTAGDLGPAYWFDLAETQISKAAYCDVGVALSRELGLGDYRPTARPEGYRNSPQAMSNNRSRGP
jgi:hypothetical protein